MQITKEKIEKDIADFTTQKTQLMAQLHAAEGAIIHAKMCLDELAKPESTPTTDSPATPT